MSCSGSSHSVALIWHHSDLTILKNMFPGSQFKTKTVPLSREFHDSRRAEGSVFTVEW